MSPGLQKYLFFTSLLFNQFQAKTGYLNLTSEFVGNESLWKIIGISGKDVPKSEFSEAFQPSNTTDTVNITMANIFHSISPCAYTELEPCAAPIPIT